MTLSTIDLTQRLDQLEHALPTIPAKSMALGRATVRRANDVVTAVVSDVARRLDRVVKVARTGTATTVGQARQASERTASTAQSAARQTVGQVRSAAGRTAKVAESAVKETVGQARSGAERTAKVATTAAKQTSGQARSQAARTAEAGADAVEALLDDATVAVDPGAAPRGKSYEQWTKAELYDRAQALDIDRRSTMTKKQLVKALRSA